MDCLGSFVFVAASIFCQSPATGPVEYDPGFSIVEEQQFINDEGFREREKTRSVDRSIREVRRSQRLPGHQDDIIEANKEAERRYQAKLEAERKAREQARKEREERERREAERREAERAAAQQAAEEAKKVANSYFLPTSNYRITATFGNSGARWSSTHTGLDFAAPSGTNVTAVTGGEVVFAGSDGAYGNKIVVQHADGTETWYCHLSGFAVSSGSVGAGQTIGYVGSTGNSTGPHLHLEVRQGGNPIDPAGWLQSKGVSP